LADRLDLLRRFWCKPYDFASQYCFQVGTWTLLVCGGTFIACLWQTPGGYTVREGKFDFDFDSLWFFGFDSDQEDLPTKRLVTTRKIFK
jgi:hypothetical protein